MPDMNEASLRDHGIQANIRHLQSIDPRSRLEPPCVIQATLAPNNRFNIGAFTGIFGGRIGHASIGRYCSISYQVDIASDQHPVDWLSTSMIQYCHDVHGWKSWMETDQGITLPSQSPPRFISNQTAVIGNDVWIGQGAFVKSGVKIGDGAIVAAHAVVVKDVNPYEIVAGVPARVIKRRFSDKICDRLLELQWWRYCLLELKDIDFSNIEQALRSIESAIDNDILKPYEPAPIVTGELK